MLLGRRGGVHCRVFINPTFVLTQWQIQDFEKGVSNARLANDDQTISAIATNFELMINKQMFSAKGKF